MTWSSNQKIADALRNAVETCDTDSLRELYAEDAEIWQNTSGRTMDRERAIRMIEWLCDTLDELSYEDVRYRETADGYVQQHTLTGTRKSDGSAVRLDACLIATIADMKLVRVDEYLDSAQTAALQ